MLKGIYLFLNIYFAFVAAFQIVFLSVCCDYIVIRQFNITPVLRSLHWLPVRQRITFKVATTVHKCLKDVSSVPCPTTYSMLDHESGTLCLLLFTT